MKIVLNSLTLMIIILVWRLIQKLVMLVPNVKQVQTKTIIDLAKDINEPN